MIDAFSKWECRNANLRECLIEQSWQNPKTVNARNDLLEH